MKPSSKPHWRVELLGSVRAVGAGATVSRFETRKTAALLVCLALERRPLSRDEMAEKLWPGEDAESIRKRLRQGLAALRKVLEPKGLAPGSVLLADRAELSLT